MALTTQTVLGFHSEDRSRHKAMLRMSEDATFCLWSWWQQVPGCPVLRPRSFTLDIPKGDFVARGVKDNEGNEPGASCR